MPPTCLVVAGPAQQLHFDTIVVQDSPNTRYDHRTSKCDLIGTTGFVSMEPVRAG